jgi:hypothetical protein
MQMIKKFSRNSGGTHMRSSSPWLRTSTFALVILPTIVALSIFSGRAFFGQRGGQAPTSAAQLQSARSMM